MAAPGLTIGQYYPADSPLHRADPRIKLLIVLLFALAIFLTNNFTGLVAVASLLFLLAAIGRLPIGLTLRGIGPLYYILAFTLLVHVWTGDGPWTDIGPMRVSISGLREGVFVNLRLILLVICAALLTLTSTPIELTDAIEHILSPLKRIRIPAHELAMMMAIALRFIPLLSVEADKIIKAQMARGVKFEAGNPLTRAKRFIPIIIPLFVSVFRRADELAEAMEARAYRGVGRTRMRELKLRPADPAILIAMSLLLAAIVWVGRLPMI